MVAQRLTDEGRRYIPADTLPASAIASHMADRPVIRVPDDGVRFVLCRLWNSEKYLNCLRINLSLVFLLYDVYYLCIRCACNLLSNVTHDIQDIDIFLGIFYIFILNISLYKDKNKKQMIYCEL